MGKEENGVLLAHFMNDSLERNLPNPNAANTPSIENTISGSAIHRITPMMIIQQIIAIERATRI